MAIFDSRANEIVIRLVYDGPPQAGKTTSLRALASSLDQAAVTPQEDASGRTLWFDYMEYAGGRFEGSRIRCQIVSVPGQSKLRHRRRALLENADAVVFVGDSGAQRWQRSMRALGELREMIADERPVPGIVLQLNKRDADDAIGLDDVRSSLRASLGEAASSIGVVQSIARDGSGIREAFIYAVRLALDRVRELMSRGRLDEGAPSLRDAEALFAKMRALEAAHTETAAATLLREILAHEAEEERRENSELGEAVPLLPDALVPSGAIWPPVEGRALLHEVSQHAIAVRCSAEGDWIGEGDQWRVVSARDDVFESLDAGRAALIQWARVHASCASALSPHRCIVLAATGDQRWRMWQVVRASESARDVVRDAIEQPSAEEAVARLCRSAQLLIEMNERLAPLPVPLPCTLDTVGHGESSATFIGLMPREPTTTHRRMWGASTLLAAELGPVLESELANRRIELRRALSRAPRRSDVDGSVQVLVANLLETPSLAPSMAG